MSVAAGSRARAWPTPMRCARALCSAGCSRRWSAKPGAGSDWARFSTQACGAKLHVVYDPDADRPIYTAVTAARVKSNTSLAVTADLDVPKDVPDVLSDRIGLLPQRQARNRHNPFANPVRLNLMSRRPINRLIGGGLPPASDPWQINLF